MNDTLEIKMPASRRMTMSLQEEDLMQQHLRDENLPEAVMPSCPVNKVLKGQKALVTGARKENLTGARKNYSVSLRREFLSLSRASEERVRGMAWLNSSGCSWTA